MKLLNIFKKNTTVVTKAKLQALEKNQLEKVVGGTDDTATDSTIEDNVLKTKHETAKNSINNVR